MRILNSVYVATANFSNPMAYDVKHQSKIQALAARLICIPIVLVSLPWVLLTAKIDWIFSGVGLAWIDPWIYWGFFLDLPAHLLAFPNTYYGSRLSWILPGYAAYKLFPPLMAVYSLHLGLYYAAVFSLYLILKNTIGQRAALVSAIFMGSYCYFLWAVGWPYPDGVGITYLLLTMLALTYAAKRRHRWLWLIVSGGLYAAMIYSQLFLVLFTLPLLLYYLFANPADRAQSLLLGVLGVLFGFLTISILLATINSRLKGDFLFYLPSVRFAMTLSGHTNKFQLPFRAWLGTAIWLAFPALTCFSSIAFVTLAASAKPHGSIRFSILFQAYALLSAFILLLVQVLGQPALQFSAYASFLIPSTCLSLGAQVAPILDRLSWRRYVLLVSAAVLILVFTYTLPYSRFGRWVYIHAMTTSLVVAATGGVLVLWRRPSLKALSCAILCLVFVLLNGINRAFRQTVPIWRDPGAQKHEFLAIVRSVRIIQSIDPSGTMFFWYKLDQPMGGLFRSVTSTYLWGYRLINERFPSLERREDSSQSPTPFARIAILSNENDAFDKADQALRTIGLWAQDIDQRTIQDGPVAYKMTIIEVRNWPAIEGIQLNANAWPQSVRLRWESQREQTVSFLGPGTRHLFNSDMDMSVPWEVNRYGRSGGLEIQPNGLTIGDKCGLYSSGDPRDHLASPFIERIPGPGFVFFSLWVKPLENQNLPTVSVQDQRFSIVAEGRILLTRADGWVLVGSGSQVDTSKKLRLIVKQRPGKVSMLDKALLVEITNRSPAREVRDSGEQ